MKRTIVYGLSILFMLSFQKVVSADWEKIFGGPENDAAFCVQQTIGGGYIIAGSTSSFGTGGNNVWLIKTDASGNKEWDKTFGGTISSDGRCVQQTSDGGFIIVGSRCCSGAGGNSDILLIKVDASGYLLWENTFGGDDVDQGSFVRQATDQGYIVLGNTGSIILGNSAIILIKTDETGNMVWEKTFGEECSVVSSVQQSNDEGYIIAGETGLIGAIDVLLFKTDANGNKQWERTFGGVYNDFATSVDQTDDGGYIITGAYGYSDSRDVWLIKTDSDGNGQWDKCIGGPDWDEGYSIQQTADGGYVITGYTSSYGAGSGDLWLVKTDFSGNVGWSKTFGGPDNEYGASVQETNDGSYIIVGSTYSFGTGDSDVFLVRADSKLSQINLLFPTEGSWINSPPTFRWNPDGGENAAFAVDIAFSLKGPIHSTWEYLRLPIYGNTWTMPSWMWQKIQYGRRVYWRVRGVDLNPTPLTVITSDEVWSFYKD